MPSSINSTSAPGPVAIAPKPSAARPDAATSDAAKSTNDSAQIDAAGELKEKLHKSASAETEAAPSADVPFSYADPTKGRRLDIRV